jgi:hypothetical protein
MILNQMTVNILTAIYSQWSKVNSDLKERRDLAEWAINEAKYIAETEADDLLTGRDLITILKDEEDKDIRERDRLSKAYRDLAVDDDGNNLFRIECHVANARAAFDTEGVEGQW